MADISYFDKNEIDGRTKVCMLIGNPVEHTLSPLIHNTLAGLCGINMVYVACPVRPGNVESAVRGAFDLGVLGLNVTVPHKIEVISSLCDIDHMAKAVGSVNTLVRTEAGYKGYNTDVSGLMRALRSDGVSLKDRDVVILGAGGAARSAAFLCAEQGSGRVFIANRSVEKAEELSDAVNGYSGTDLCKPISLNNLTALDSNSLISIQATSVGLYPDTESAVVEDPAFYEKVEYGFDLVYRPGNTKFMRNIRERGKKCSNGITMLLYQGIRAFELWNHINVSDEMSAKLLVRLKEAL